MKNNKKVIFIRKNEALGDYSARYIAINSNKNNSAKGSYCLIINTNKGK